MRRLFNFIVKIAVVTALAAWLAREPGHVRIVWHNSVIDTSAAFLLGFVLVVGFGLFALYRLWYLFRHGHALWRVDRHLRKLKRGHDHVTQGLIAVAGGDAPLAGQKAVEARRLLGSTPITCLLQAQAAQLAGDDGAARHLYRQLADDPESAILGYRGLIMDARRRNDFEAMAQLAEELRQQRPDTPWLNFILFTIATRQQKWDEAGLALADGGLTSLLGAAQLKRARAALLIVRTREENEQGHADAALEAAEQAARQAPDWLPAVLNLAQIQLVTGHGRAARRLIAKKWTRLPHPALARLYRSEDDKAIDGFKHVKELCASDEENPVDHMVLAEAALDADLWGEARRHLMALIAHETATQGTYRMLGKLERRETGDEQAALQWLAKAVDAPADPQWLCRTCGGAHADWQATCRYCHSFVTLEWQSPGTGRRSLALAEPLEIDAGGVIHD